MGFIVGRIGLQTFQELCDRLCIAATAQTISAGLVRVCAMHTIWRHGVKPRTFGGVAEASSGGNVYDVGDGEACETLNDDVRSTRFWCFPVGLYGSKTC